MWIAHAMEVDNAFESTGSERVGRHFRISLPMWTNGLRFIDDAGITVDELRSRARAMCNIGGLERWGWISVDDVGGRRRSGYGTHRGVTGHSILRPTHAGAYARRLWPRTLGDVEDRWRTRFGSQAIDALRQALLAVAVSMPWAPPEIHPSDGFYSHIVDGGDPADDEPPLSALLGQVLTAMALDHEQGSEVPFPLGADILRVTGSDVVRLRDVPLLSGISKEAVATGTGYLQRHGLSTALPERAVRLTPKGLDALEGYRERVARATNTELQGALDAVVAQRGAMSAGLVTPEGRWRGQKPYMARTKRLLVDPTGALPWYPMVLHRGGWPDGS